MERPHGQLRAGLADRLSGDDANGFTLLDQSTAGEIAAVAGHANAMRRLAHHDGPYVELVHAGVHHFAHEIANRTILGFEPVGQFLSAIGDHLAGLGVNGRRQQNPAQNRGPELVLGHLLAAAGSCDPESIFGAAVVDRHDHVLRHIDQTASQISGVRCPQRRVGETLSSAVRRKEVLEDGQSLAEVRANGDVDDLPLRVEHESAHAGHLADLVHVSLSARVGHHEYGVLAAKPFLHVLGQFVAGRVPDQLELSQALLSVTSPRRYWRSIFSARSSAS